MQWHRWRSIDVVFPVGGAIALAVAIWFWPVGPPPIYVPPSFNCARATLPSEKTICTDPLLAKTDAEFAVYYQDNLAVVRLFRYSEMISVLEKGEREFIEARNRCGTVTWCIYRAYLDRQIQLTDLVGEPRRVTPPLRLPFRLTEYVGADFMAWVATLVRGPPGNGRRPTPAARCERAPTLCADE
jgi:hypothetical protein